MKPSTICTVAAIVFLFVGLPFRARGSGTSPNSVLKATYGWQGEALLALGKTASPKVGDFVPLVQVGYLTFDGNGNISGAHDTNLGGRFIPHVDSGSYSVNSDCVAGTSSLSNGLTLNIVITNGGQEIKYVSATTGGVNSGTLRLMAVSCSAGILSGNSYAYFTHGLVGAGNSNSFPRVGLANVGPVLNTSAVMRSHRDWPPQRGPQ